MKTIAINSVKGGTGKSTLAVLIINALTMSGFRCLVIDADASNNSLSFALCEGGTADAPDTAPVKTVFHLFMGEPVQNCVIKVNDCLDLIRGDVRLNEFRSTDSLKRLKRSLAGQDYDFCVIDTSPTYDNIIGNVLTACETLIVPVEQDLFSYQALKYQFEKLADLELDIDAHIVFNQFEKPLTDNQSAYRNQITNLFLEDEVFKPFINPCRISRSSVYRKYINRQNYRLEECKAETRKGYGEIKDLIQSILGVAVEEAI
jgi:chromosome partitioning protein